MKDNVYIVIVTTSRDAHVGELIARDLGDKIHKFYRNAELCRKLFNYISAKKAAPTGHVYLFPVSESSFAAVSELTPDFIVYLNPGRRLIQDGGHLTELNEQHRLEYLNLFLTPEGSNVMLLEHNQGNLDVSSYVDQILNETLGLLI